MTPKTIQRALRLLLLALTLGLSGCLSAPDDVQQEFSAPDNSRPNNYRPTYSK